MDDLSAGKNVQKTIQVRLLGGFHSLWAEGRAMTMEQALQIVLVELAPLSDPELVPQACTQTLEVIEQSGFSFTELLAHYLEKKDLLLILDNCEHMIEACTQLVDRLLKACPRLHILATSREILSVPGENPFRVPSLEIPGLHSLPPLLRIGGNRGGAPVYGTSRTSFAKDCAERGQCPGDCPDLPAAGWHPVGDRTGCLTGADHDCPSRSPPG